MSVRTLKITAYILGLITLTSDQLLKSITLWRIPDNGIFLFNSKLLSIQLKLALNDYIAFSIPIPRSIIYVLTISLCTGIFYFFLQAAKNNKTILALPLAIITGAALSNLLDRMMRGAVVDYFNLTIYNYHWATFNLADSLITICAIIILIANFRKKI